MKVSGSLLRRFAFALSALALAGCGDQPGSANADAQDTAQRSSVERPDDMAFGDPNAPITLIEYASVTCPFCASFHAETLPQIKSEWIDEGKVRFIFRELPSPPIPLSMAGFITARCAGAEGGTDKYFAVIDVLFRTQREWITNQDPRGELLTIARSAGLSEDQFDACLNDPSYVETITDIVQEGGAKYDARSTPTFIVNGEKYNLTNAEPGYVTLERAFNKALGVDG
ncbi:MAG: DsbA family protein [Maricaulaceae bacterium]